MTRSSDIAPYLVHKEDESAFHQGVVLTWDSLTGQNTVDVAGGILTDVAVLSTGDSIMLAAGDNVFLIRFKSTFFILGRISPAGSGALGIRSAASPATGFTNSTTYGDLSIGAGPSLSSVFIPTTRRCLVLVCTAIYANVNDDGAAHFSVSGASTITPPTGGSAFSEGAFMGGFGGTTATEGTATRTFLLTSADGLNTGLHTFTMKYLSRAGGDASFSDKVITVLPF